MSAVAVAPSLFRDRRLLPVWDKVRAGARLDRNDGLLLFDTEDLHGLGRMADFAQSRRYGDQVPLQHHTAASGVCDAPITVAPTDRDPAIPPQRTATGHHQRFAPLPDDDAFSELDAVVERPARARNRGAVLEDKRAAVAIVD